MEFYATKNECLLLKNYMVQSKILNRNEYMFPIYTPKEFGRIPYLNNSDKISPNLSIIPSSSVPRYYASFWHIYTLVVWLCPYGQNYFVSAYYWI